MYTPQGDRINSLEEALASKMILIFKGGYFIWPGISIGYKRELPDISGIGSITLITLSLQPLLFELSGFLTLEECDHIRTIALPFLQPSPVSKMDHDIDKAHTNWRTSHNCFLDSYNDPILQAIDERVIQVTKASLKHQEAAQVLRYELGQRYSAHHDYFPPQFYQSPENSGTLAMLDGGRNNRYITVFWYLSDVEEGGETIFPRAGGKPSPTDFNDCINGLKVTPKEGKAIMFYSMTPEGQFDEYSLHGACPVIKGTKWAANKWIWTRG
jgi:prolyl 4-hydroxylase